MPAEARRADRAAPDDATQAVDHERRRHLRDLVGRAAGLREAAELGAAVGRRRFCLLAATLPAWAAAAPGPPWIGADGRTPTPLAHAALQRLAAAGEHGLEPDDYGVPPLQRALAPGAVADAAAAALLDRLLAAGLLRYLSDLHFGRLGPAGTGTRFVQGAQDGFDAAVALQAAVKAQDLGQAERAAVPQLAQYEALREALRAYRVLADHPAWKTPLVLPARLAAGDRADGVPRLAERLQALGDLAAPHAAGPQVDAALEAALRSFQERHGLQSDGVLGPATAAALRVTPRQRVRQLELALERLRSTPLRQAARMIVVNVPEFVLRAYAVEGERVRLHLRTRVIVGRALDTRTPLIGEDLERIEFRPYWNVPASIARAELVPLLRREPGVWARDGFEFVGPLGPSAHLTEAGLQAVLDGQARIRQRPGPANALGDIKFVFPNRASVYLHHTPSVGLFERARRDFSHGCIRVEDPVALAAFALHGLPGWDVQRIRAAMTEAPPSTVALAAPVPVLVAYGTALVEGGRVRFLADVYGHDRTLDAALRRLSARRLPPTQRITPAQSVGHPARP